jgi:hypothetical protein
MAIVYRHRDNKDKIFYIGIGKNESRAFDYQHRSNFWKRYSKKYGVNTEIIIENISFEQAKELEVLLISEYGRKDLKTGDLVNMTNGGDGSLNSVVSDETRKKMSQSHTGKILKESTKKKVSEARKGSGNGMYKKMPHNASKVFCEELNMSFNTIKSCAKSLNISQSYLSNMLMGKRPNIYKVSKI